MRQKFDRAIDEVRQAVVMDPSDEEAQLMLGSLYVANNDSEAAIAQQKEVRSMNPDLALRLFNNMHSDKIVTVSRP
jgi:lipopolysaccharide biosynthesis regulator YciM